MTDPNLLIDQEWTGTFFPPKRSDLSFAGRLRYSPTDGVRLEYARPMAPSDSKSKWDFLHGHTSTGTPLTLVGEFSTEGNGFTIKNGMHYWTSTGHAFRCAIFGYHFNAEDTFDTFEFDMTGAQEFFGPNDHKYYAPHIKGDIFSVNSIAGKISILHNTHFNFASDDLRAHFYSDDVTAMDELQKAYAQVRTDNPGFRPYLKKSLDYLFRFVPKREMKVIEAYPMILSIADLFSLLAFEPVRLTKLSAIARDEGGNPHPMTIFPFAIDNKVTVERSLEKRDFHKLPLNNSNVDLELLIRNWLDQHDRFSSTTSMLQSMTNTVAMHEIYGGIVLSATQLEDMAAEAGCTSKQEKYDYGLKHHASDNLRRSLASHFQCNETAIGKAISDLRSEIAHVRKTRTYINKLGSRKTYLVSRSLQLVVIGYILEQIGVSTTARENYQDVLHRAF